MQPLWTPPKERVERSNMYRFMQTVNTDHHQFFADYGELYQWSVDNPALLWQTMWDFIPIIASRRYENVLQNPGSMREAVWFDGSRLNFAENLLRFRDDRTALVFRGEDRLRIGMSYEELYRSVAQTASSLKKLGLSPGDRVVGFMPNRPEAVIAMLAAASLGCLWSSCSPDFGIKGVLDRFGQIQPKILFTGDGYYFKGKWIDSLEKIGEIAKKLPSLERIIIVPYLKESRSAATLPGAVLFDDFIDRESEEIDFVQLPFDHPLYIMYSSGTTGLPKCMVQSGGGVLIHQLKELILHTDLRRDDTIFYFTTCGWMMWNWLVASLGVGATIILYDGNPFYPEAGSLWQMAEEESITVFGTSAGYIAALKATGVKPRQSFDLAALKTILSTGSPLSAEDFSFVYSDIKEDVLLASISGGSDLNGCFALGNPMLPVYSGELQCRGLGMKVFAYDESGQPVTGRQGELVCTAPFPSMPVYFWDDEDDSTYHSAYFDHYPGVWTHGDFIEVTERGGLIMYGRSDATLNPGGVRIGTSEIYRIVEQIEGIDDSVVVGQHWDKDTRVILFVKLTPGYELDEPLRQRIRTDIRNGASPRHVPAKILKVPDIPYTLNMKKVELAVHKVIHGREVKNKDALKNPEALVFFAEREELET